MHTQSHTHQLANRHHTVSTSAALAALLAVLTTLGGCKKHSDAIGHDHGGAPPTAHDHTPQAPGVGRERDSDPDQDQYTEDAHSDEVTLTKQAIERYGVTVQAAQLRVLTPTLTAPARVGFNTESMAHVGSPLPGRVVEINVRLGDPVEQGDPLLVVESPELGEAQADFFQKRIAAQAASPAVDLTKAAWERAKGLHEQSQGLSLAEVQKREAEYKAAITSQRAAEAAMIGSENRLRLLGMTDATIKELGRTGEITPRCTLRAPIDGQVVGREITLGELVSPEREALLVLANTRTLWVLADVPEARLHEVAVGAPARVIVGTTAGPGARSVGGAVAFIAPLIDAGTRTAQVRVEVPSEPLALRPGMFAVVEITAIDPATKGPAPVVAVPDEAVQTIEGGTSVFVPVEGEPATFAKRAIAVGTAVGGWVPVLSGLAEGEEYVAGGTFILKAELGKGGAAHEH